jgi:hypothetical protein
MQLLLHISDDTTCPPAELASTDIAAITAALAATVEGNDGTKTNDHLGSPSSVCACTPACHGSKLPAPPTTGKPNVWLSRLLSTSSLTVDVRHVA